MWSDQRLYGKKIYHMAVSVIYKQNFLCPDAVGT